MATPTDTCHHRERYCATAASWRELAGEGLGAVITEAHIKERLSLAYVHAVSGRAGINVAHSIHDYGVDGTLTPVDQIGSSFAESGFIMHFQLKATTRWKVSGSNIVYELEASTYNNMVRRHPSAVPLVLVLMCLPTDESLWLRSNDKLLVMKNSCYWLWLPHGAETQNTSTKTVKLPKKQLLTTAGVTSLLASVRRYTMGQQSYV